LNASRAPLIGQSTSLTALSKKAKRGAIQSGDIGKIANQMHLGNIDTDAMVMSQHSSANVLRTHEITAHFMRGSRAAAYRDIVPPWLTPMQAMRLLSTSFLVDK